MHEIFISYSSADRKNADQLAELLSSAGLSVWIDQSALDAAASWSAEIVDAINDCKVFIVMLSPNSIGSHNVIKEVSLASEKRKKILPLDLEPITLPRELEYQLAGIHRAPMTNIDAIIRALGKLGLEATSAPTLKLIKEKDGRKSLMILPFEDLSPTGDNSWFADGIATELISALTNVKSLKVTDQQTTKEFKKYSGHLTTYAKEMGIRYFIQGSVRKFGDQIKIASSLLDIETGDHLWQDSMKGTMNDIFDIQETVAKKAVEGLNVILTKEEEDKVKKKLTENAEAYELYLKGIEYFTRHTISDIERAIALYEEAIQLDPRFAGAYAEIANASQELYRTYSRIELHLIRAESAVAKVREIDGETARYFCMMSLMTLRRGDPEGALRFARRTIETNPAYAMGYDSLSHAYRALGMREEAVEAGQELVRLLKNSRGAHQSLLISLNELGDSPAAKQRLRQAAERAIPVYERHVRLNPDDYHARAFLANVFQMAGRDADALLEAEKLSVVDALDGQALYNLACLYLHVLKNERGMLMLRRSVEKGFRSIETIRRDPDLDPLRGTAEFEEMMKDLEGKIKKEKNV